MNNLDKFFDDAKRKFGLNRYSQDFEQIQSLPNGFVSSCRSYYSFPSISAPRLGDVGKDSVWLDIWIEPKNPSLRELGFNEFEFNIIVSINGQDTVYRYGSDSWEDILDHVPEALSAQKTAYNDLYPKRSKVSKQSFVH